LEDIGCHDEVSCARLCSSLHLVSLQRFVALEVLSCRSVVVELIAGNKSYVKSSSVGLIVWVRLKVLDFCGDLLAIVCNRVQAIHPLLTG